MVQRSRRGKRKDLAGGHNRAWLWGRHAVVQTLETARWPIRELYLADALPADERQRLTSLAEPWSPHIESPPPTRLTQLCGSAEHQGYLLRLGPYPYVPAEEICSSLKPNSLIVVLDRIQDPYNFGALLRSAEAFAVDAILVPDAGQSEINAHVVRSSAGAAAYLNVARCGDLPATIAQLTAAGATPVAASEHSAMPLSDVHLTGPTILVLGNEGSGIEPELLDLCPTRVRIPQYGRTPSLNVAVAGGILMCDFRRQLNHTIAQS